MKNTEALAKITEFVDKAHGVQMRKYTPDRYIVHPERVMKMLQAYTNDITVLAAALLHDVLEDTVTTKEEILDFLKTVMDDAQAKRTVELVVELTDVYTKTAYPHYNRRKRKTLEVERMEKTSKNAQTIKYADIIDNCKEIVGHDPSFARIFLYECRTLLRKMKNGDTSLYEKALETVDANISSLAR